MFEPTQQLNTREIVAAVLEAAVEADAALEAAAGVIRLRVIESPFRSRELSDDALLQRTKPAKRISPLQDE